MHDCHPLGRVDVVLRHPLEALDIGPKGDDLLESAVTAQAVDVPDHGQVDRSGELFQELAHPFVVPSLHGIRSSPSGHILGGTLHAASPFGWAFAPEERAIIGTGIVPGFPHQPFAFATDAETTTHSGCRCLAFSLASAREFAIT
jgi:hypothetical protein